jgi:hypothetical protein
MRELEDLLWTWLLPDVQRNIDREEWRRSGGKWIFFDKKNRIEELAGRLGPLINSGKIESAKYWNKDPSALCVYSLDKDKDATLEILRELGAGEDKVWEYDYAWDKNIQNPVHFIYSWSSKFRTILQSYGVIGTLQLIRAVLTPRKQ